MDLSPLALQLRAAALGAGILEGGPGTLAIYPAPRPAPGGAPAAPSLVGLPITAASASGGDLTLTTSPANATGSGVPVWARILSGAGDWLIDGNVGEPDSGELLELPADTTIYAGGEIGLTSAVLHPG